MEPTFTYLVYNFASILTAVKALSLGHVELSTRLIWKPILNIEVTTVYQ